MSANAPSDGLMHLQVETTLGVFEVTAEAQSPNAAGADPAAASTTDAAAASVSTAPISVWQVLLPSAMEASANPQGGAAAGAQSNGGGKFAGLKKAANARKNDVERRLKKMILAADGIQAAVRGRQRYSDVRKIIAHSGVVTTIKQKVPPASATKAAGGGNDKLGGAQAVAPLNVSYRHQGNLELYSSLNIRKRDENRRHPDVVTAIDAIWEALPKAPGGLNRVNKSIYTWFNRKLFFALVPNATESEFLTINNEDWKNDAVWTSFLTQRAFHTAMFNLADIWCETIEPQEYRDFLTHCKGVIASGEPYRMPQRGTALALEDQSAVEDTTADPGEISLAGQLKQFKNLTDGAGATATPGAAVLNAPYADRRKNLAVLGYGLSEADIAAFLAEEEKLEEGLFEAENRSWVEVAQSFLQAEFQEEELVEDDIVFQLQVNRRKREKAFGELTNSDRVAVQEKRFLEFVKSQCEHRVDAQRMLSTRLNTAASERDAKLAPLKSFTQRRAQRVANHQALVQEQKETFGVFLDTFSRSNVRFRDERRETVEVEASRLGLKMKNTDPYDHPQLTYLRHKAALLEHQSEVDEDLADNVFKEFTLVAQNLREAREVLLWQTVDPLHDAMFGDDVAGDNQGEDMQLGTKQWHSVTRWLERNTARYNELAENVLESIALSLKSLKARETKVHKFIVEWHARLRDAMLQVIRDDPCLTAGVMQRRVQEHEHFFAAVRSKDDKHAAALKARHKQMDEDIMSLFTSHSQLRMLQSQCMQGWRNGLTVTDVVAESKPFFEFLDEGRVGSTMEETTFVAAKLVGQASVNFSDQAQVEAINSPTNLAVFAAQLQFSWFGFYFERVTSERHRLYHDFALHVGQLEDEQVLLLANLKLQIRSDRVEDLEHYKAALAQPKCPVGFLGKEIVKGRLEQRTAINAALQKAKTWHDNVVARVDSTKVLRDNEAHERRMRLAKLFAMRRVHHEIYAGVAAQQLRLFEQRHFLDPTRLHRVEAAVGSDAKGKMGETDLKLLAVKQRREQQEAALKEQRDKEAKRMEELERKRQDSREASEDAKRAQELRRHAFLQREQQQKERLKAERDAKAQWQRQFLEEEKRRQKEEADRLAWQKFVQTTRPKADDKGARRPSRSDAPPSTSPVPALGGAAVPASTTAPPPSGTTTATVGAATGGSQTPTQASLAPAVPKVRRKSTGNAAAAPTNTYQPVKVTKPTAGGAAGGSGAPPVGGGLSPKTVTAPSDNIKSLIEERIRDAAPSPNNAAAAGGGDLHGEFPDRRLRYLLDRLSNAEIYRRRCMELHVAPDAPFHASLSAEPLSFSLNTLKFCDRPCHFATILDVVLLNPVQRVGITNADMVDDDVLLLCQAAVDHEFMSQIDLSGNAKLTVKSAQALIVLMQRSRRVVRVKLDGTQFLAAAMTSTHADHAKSVPRLAELKEWMDNNRASQSIGRQEMRFMRTLFDAMDRDGSGLVSLEELRSFRKVAESAKSSGNLNGSVGSPFAGASIGKSTEAAIEDVLRRRIEDVVLKLIVARQDGDGEFSFSDFVGFLFPFWSPEYRDTTIARFGGNSGSGGGAEPASPVTTTSAGGSPRRAADDFVTTMSIVTNNASDQDHIAEMKEFFAEFAVNSALTLASLARGLGDSETNLEAAFLECDVDGDGVLSLEEFLSFMSAN